MNGYSIGLDLSLCNTGWNILDLKNSKYINSGTIITTPIPKRKTKKIKKLKECELEGIYRFHYIKQKIKFALDKYKPKIATIENYAFSVKKSRSVFQIGELGGIIKYLLFIRNIPFYLTSPQSLKKFANGKGGSGKDIVERGVYNKWGKKFKTSHETDAFVLAKIGYGILQRKEKIMLSYEKEVIDVICRDEACNNYIVERRKRK